MSVPPQLIRVKRKATEESPVSFLRVQENKRQRSEAYVYKRQEERPTFAENIPQKPIVHISQPSQPSQSSQTPTPTLTPTPTPEIQSLQTPDSGADQPITDKPTTEEPTINNGADSKPADGSDPKTPNTAGISSEQRRFHMSRKDMMLGAPSPLGRTTSGVSKKRAGSALFIERKIKKVSSRIQALAIATGSAPAPVAAVTEDIDMDLDKPEDKPEPRKFKKPGVAKLAKNKEPAQTYKAEPPKSLTEPWNADSDKLTSEMNAFAMAQIGLNLQKASDEKAAQAPKAKPALKFQPKHVKRWAERHPETAQAPADVDMMDTDADLSESDDGEYIIETYERVPANKLGEEVPAHTVGLIVLDEDPELELFYGDGVDSDDEWAAEEEQDENAENYYGADYPEDEVASDDEFGNNPYSYRTRNASDLEEYDLLDDGLGFSDEDNGEGGGGFKAYVNPSVKPKRLF